MSSKKTTVNLEEKLLEDLDLIAEALDQTRNKVIAEALQEYASRNINRARAIFEKQAELQKLKQSL